MGERTEFKVRRPTQVMKQLADSDIKKFLENIPLYVWRQLRPFQDLGSRGVVLVW